MENSKTAAILVIGNEILSGRTLDTNTQHIAHHLAEIGIDLVETRTIKDDAQKIIEIVRDFSSNYDIVFTSGGIGPTHDDITSEALSKAFDVAYQRNDEAYNILDSLYKQRGETMNAAREKMAYMPAGSELINYYPPGAPGFKIKNVYALAGVPYVMKAMMESIMPQLGRGQVVKSKNLDVMIGESAIAEDFSKLQDTFPQVSMGSYPFVKNGQHGTSLVLRSSDYHLLDSAYEGLKNIVQKYVQNTVP